MTTLLHITTFTILLATPFSASNWGFYSHRLINRMAVFTLPSDLIGLYKQNIDFVSDHAVDPDKRRYATKYEAVRHYIDLDHWGVLPFENVPRKWSDALAAHAEVVCINGRGDTTVLYSAEEDDNPSGKFHRYFTREIIPRYYEEIWLMECDSLRSILPETDCSACVQTIVREGFSAHGILPYHLVHMQQQLTAAFEQRNVTRILRLSADFGHYIGDAHVPLHTTENYNGQLTGQTGIHGFWETRIPELFAEDEYDFLVGKAEYIQNPRKYYWDIVIGSHSLVNDVLDIEERLSKTFPEDQQYCFEERLERTIRTYCSEYAKAFSEAMQGMVESRMRDAIHAIGSAWYTAWVDAGQPEFKELRNQLDPEEQAIYDQLERQFRTGVMKGREHIEN